MSFRLEGVTYAYPPRRDRRPDPANGRPVLRGLTLEIPSAATVAVLGASGVGKSTLLYLLGLLWDGELAAGSIQYTDRQGREFAYNGGMSGTERAGLRLREFGFALQSSYLLSNFTCLDNVAMPLALRGDGLVQRRRDARKLIEGAQDPELLERCEELPADVSGGQRQRFAVLRAFVHDPQVVFADEPFSSLDEENAEKILALLRTWRDADPSRTLLLVCHDPEIAHREASHLILIGRSGKAIEDRVFLRSEFERPDDLRDRLRGAGEEVSS
jgi:ABC-type lipoprotein export system ATPase subunit